MSAPAAPSETPWPFPVAFGWYSAGYSNEFAPGRVETRRYVERDLVVWREVDGTPHVMDAHCPHMGAHLGVGGCVRNGDIVCPFHGWSFDGTGKNVDIPYADKTNRRATVRSFPTVERNGMVLFWYHPDPKVAPVWEIPELEIIADGHFEVKDEFTVETAWQEIAENAVDGAHFQFVHGTTSPGQIAFTDVSKPVRHQKVNVAYNTKNGPIEGWQESWSYGPGIGMVQFHIFGDAFLITSNTPIERQRMHVRFAWAFAPDAISRMTGVKFAEEVRKQFIEDIPIWENKVFLAKPALAPSEKALLQLRKWASQFYADTDAG